jgi:hypothetical protein
MVILSFLADRNPVHYIDLVYTPKFRTSGTLGDYPLPAAQERVRFVLRAASRAYDISVTVSAAARREAA